MPTDTLPRRDYRLEEALPGAALCIAFTSYGDDGSPPPPEAMEWASTLNSVPCHKLHLLDVFQHWYHGPILNFSSGLGGALAEIRRIMDRLQPSSVVTLGTSMGGHGALLFGALLEVDAAFTVAPQVDVSAAWLAEIADRRWAKFTELNAIGYEHLDLVALYARQRPASTLIYYDSNDPLDALHAERLRDFPGVSLHPRPGAGHLLAYEMVKTGEATECLRALLAP